MNQEESVEFAVKYLEDIISFFGENVLVDGEVEDVAACDVIDGDHGDLGDGPLAQRRAQTVDMRHGLVREYPVGVRDVTRAVGALDIGDVFDAVGFGLCREARDEQQTEEEKEAFHNHGQK